MLAACRYTRSGLSLVGMLVSLGCMLVLAVILMSTLNTAITGAGNAGPNTVRSFEDKMALAALHQSLVIASHELDGSLPVPSEIAPGERALDTTANFYSLLVMQNRATTESLISGNEYSPFVQPDLDYDYSLYDPIRDVHWDPSFKADLRIESNTSFAHMPMFGARFEEHWRRASFDPTMPLLGNRGPKQGRPDPQSYTHGRDGAWAGHLVFGDGHIDFTDQFTLASRMVNTGTERVPDNLFAFDESPDGGDAMLTFTSEMSETGPVVQHD